VAAGSVLCRAPVSGAKHVVGRRPGWRRARWGAPDLAALWPPHRARGLRARNGLRTVRSGPRTRRAGGHRPARQCC